MRKYFLLLVVFALFSFAGTSLKKRISDEQFRYEFYTTDKVVSLKASRQYYWFKGGAIHNAESGMAGELLHEEFQKFYHSNQLAESGTYDYGLKDGYWKTWYPSGTLQSKTFYNDGLKDGSYYAYDETGFLVESGKYKNNSKHGQWVNYKNKDTLKYKNGIIVPTRIKDTISSQNSQSSWFKRLFVKKTNNRDLDKKDNANGPQKVVKDNPEKVKKENFFRRLFYGKEKTNKKGELKSEKEIEKDNKGNFFKRLFSPRDNKANNNGKGT